jgi:hypothetical protein
MPVQSAARCDRAPAFEHVEDGRAAALPDTATRTGCTSSAASTPRAAAHCRSAASVPWA